MCTGVERCGGGHPDVVAEAEVRETARVLAIPLLKGERCAIIPKPALDIRDLKPDTRHPEP